MQWDLIDALRQVKTALGFDMENHAQNSLADAYAAALDWWRDAGVDCDFSDEPQIWLEQDRERPQPAKFVAPLDSESAAPPPPAQAAIKAGDLPADLKSFTDWWMSEESPLPTGASPRIAPRGTTGAPILLLVPMPESEDRQALLQGPQGKLLANIARAIGVDPDHAYLASALPSHMPLPDWRGLAVMGLGTAVTHHIALARPSRVLIFGNRLPALLGQDPDAPPEDFNEIAGIPALTTFAPERLLDHPRQRARLWQRLLEWKAR